MDMACLLDYSLESDIVVSCFGRMSGVNLDAFKFAYSPDGMLFNICRRPSLTGLTNLIGGLFSILSAPLSVNWLFGACKQLPRPSRT